MSPLIPITLIGFPLLALVLRIVMPPTRAALAVVLAGWLFLPGAAIDVPGFPDYVKHTAVAAGLTLTMLFFDFGRVLRLRGCLSDGLMVVWCTVPVATSLSNDLGLKNGVGLSLDHAIAWGIPYLAGRVYVTGARELRELAGAFVVAGLVYTPLCFIELMLSPQLHRWLYGQHLHSFDQTMRFGGWRPTVFMRHGLEVGFLMSMAALSAVWLWRTGALRRVGHLPMSLGAPGLVVMALLCKSVGAIGLAVVGGAALFGGRWLGARAMVWGLILLVPAYMAVRLTGSWSGESAISLARELSEDRANSLKTRFDAEALLIGRAMERPLLGWDGFRRNRVTDAEGNDLAITDGLWILELGLYGFVGLVSLYGATLVPAARALRAAPAARWGDPTVAAAVGLGVIVSLYAIDSLLNAPVSPMYVFVTGALAALPRLTSGPLRAPVPRPAAAGVRVPSLDQP
ncbi:MAG: O-antigen ligase domain-containing protein [Phycisphaerales bacterium]